MKRITRALVVGVLLLAACSSGPDDSVGIEGDPASEASTTTGPTSTATAVPEPTTEVLFTYVNDEPLVRFAAEIKNPAAQARVGVRTTWKVLDVNGVIVGTLEDSERAAIPPGGSIYYVGGAGALNLTGVPATVEFEVTDPGTLTDEPPAPSATAGIPTFERAGFDYLDNTRTYDSSFVISASAEVTTDNLDTVILMRDAFGSVIAAAWADTSAAPSTLEAGEKINATAQLYVTSGEPASIEAYAYG